MNTFQDLWKTLSGTERADLALRADTHITYLYQIASGHRMAGASLIERLMAADNRITFQMMRTAPDEAA